ncbi:MAG: DUF456 domain-containing protein [Anaerolineales bacterium]
MAFAPSLSTVDFIIKGITLMVMLVGLLVLPLLPGLTIIWAAALGYGLAVGFGPLGWVMFVLITVLMLAATVLNYVVVGASANKEGTPWWVSLLALLAAIIGSFIIPIPIIGGILSALLTLFVIECIRRKDWHKALASIKGMLVGWGWALVFRLVVGVLMIGLWVIWAWA